MLAQHHQRRLGGGRCAACPRAADLAPLRRARVARATITPRSGNGNGAPATPEPQRSPEPSSSSSSPPSSLDLAFESAQPPLPIGASFAATPTIKTTGLRRAPLSGGVKTATERFDLPAPSVAVRNLVEQAHFAHLCTVMSHMHHRRAGYPFGTLVDFACDGAGLPIFCLSPLAIHARNLIEDPRCSLVVQMPGWTGLANARVTIFGDVYQLPADMQDAARDVFLAKQAADAKEKWVVGNFLFFRMHRIVDIYFVGGFGTVQWIDVAEYLGVRPDAIATRAPQKTLQALNETFATELKEHLLPHVPLDDAAFISIDASGADVRVRHGSDFNVERIGFDARVEDLEGAIEAVRGVFGRGRDSRAAASSVAKAAVKK